ncbi:hypothetical protein FLONG3_758 [Fusarium longipes]|uniref:Uncharacterized protein n=1 Tax=Fusarium longipes TaxID=694270 RepID=A0A395T8X4_9HYPO|nr:hypothetical protein FLONG3_758 [Fusarium longipes]
MEGPFIENSLQAAMKARLSESNQGNQPTEASVAAVADAPAVDMDPYAAGLDFLGGFEPDFDFSQFDDQLVEEPFHPVDCVLDEHIDPELHNDASVPLQEQVGPKRLSNATRQSNLSPPRQSLTSPPRQVLGHSLTATPQSFGSPPSQLPVQYGQLYQSPPWHPNQGQHDLFGLPQQSAAWYPQNPYPCDYQPQVSYPDEGINGHVGAISIPQFPPVLDPMVGYLPLAYPTTDGPNANPSPQPAAICMNCGRMAHYGSCPLPKPLPQSKPLLQPTPSVQPGRGVVARSLPPPKQRKPVSERRWMDESDDAQTIQLPVKVVKKSDKNINRRVPRNTREKKVEPGPDVFPYPAFGQISTWQTTNGLVVSYTREGQLGDDVLFDATTLRDYLDQNPRRLKIWLQNAPSKCKGRLDPADTKCRYSECPAKFGTILHGWHRVALDEFHVLTSNGTKDPYKMAGVMHLWCLEQCYDPLELMEKGIMFPDERRLPYEDLNRMAITRDDYKRVIEGGIRPWVRERRRVGTVQAPYERHEDTLSWALCNFHVKSQNATRGKCRNMRNADRPDDEKKTIEIIMGDLSEYIRREQLARARGTRRYVKSKRLSSEPTEPSRVGRRSPRTQHRSEEILDVIEVAEVAPEKPEQVSVPFEPLPISDADFADLASFIQQSKEDDTFIRPLTPQSLGLDLHGNIENHDVPSARVLKSPSSMVRLSPPKSPKGQDDIHVITTTQAADSPLGLESLFGSLTERRSSSGSRKRSRSDNDVAASESGKKRRTSSLESKRSELRRSSRVSVKRTSF